LPATVVVVVVVLVVVTVVVPPPTTLDGDDAAVVRPLEVIAVTSARSLCPESAVRTPYVRPVAPEMLTQFEPSASHRCHCRANEEAAGDQLPLLTVSSWPTTADPVTTGRTVFDGPFREPTTSLAADVADALPSALVAVTTTRNVRPTSPDVGV
jgi:hypothetical protein